MPRTDPDDPLTEFAIETLLATPEGWRAVVRDAAARWPDTAPLGIVFALVSAAAEIEATFAHGSPAREAAGHGFRVAGLLAGDLYAMEALGLPRARAGDLFGYWRGHDPFFLTL
ncbi:MAG: hypothetical protein JXJ18_07765 [Rhodobacteraceae bacterium]|nr:hypothetical protein [Paracoccaceae bacterium]